LEDQQQQEKPHQQVEQKVKKHLQRVVPHLKLEHLQQEDHQQHSMMTK
jgi:hypothetical protein